MVSCPELVSYCGRKYKGKNSVVEIWCIMCSVSIKGKKWKERDVHTTINVIINQIMN